jgi:Fur family ferric uptake transcriptional regulator
LTVAPQSLQLHFASLEEAVAELRRQGLRLSAARRLVLETLFAADRPVSAEELAAGLGGRVPPSDLASTYRNLEALERHGIVQHVHLGHGPGLYALAGAGEREYLVCERCGAFTAAHPAELDAIREHIRVTFGYVARFSHFPVVGLCAACAEADATGEPREGFHAHS